MNIKFQHITRNGKKVYAFSGSLLPYESENELRKRIKEAGREVKGKHKKFSDFTKEELQAEIDADIKFLNAQPNDVFSMFKQYFGIDLYDLSKSDCLVNQDRFIKVFTKEEKSNLISSGRNYKSFWHFMCGHLHMCPKTATINFKKIKNNLESIGKDDKHGIYDSFSEKDVFWCYKIVDILHKTFGDKQAFYFGKWYYCANPKTDRKLQLKY